MEIFIYESDLDHIYKKENYSYLSHSEKMRADQYVFPKDRNRFISGRALLRTLLGQWLHIAPKDVPIRISHWGKPHVEGLFFNLSHCEEKIVFAISREGALGIDMEKRNKKYWTDVDTGLIFSCDEINAASKLTPEEKESFFLDLWIKKEALIKGIGCGFMLDPVSINTKDRNLGWYFTPIPLANPYVAYLATQKENCYVYSCT